MAITRIECPECGAGLKSADGFTPGDSIACPKCESDFTVEEPTRRPVKAVASRDDDDDDLPRKKKKKKSQDEDGDGRSYKNSPLRFVILGVLVVIMGVLGVMLYMKKKKEKEIADAGPAEEPPANVQRPPQGGQPGGGPKMPNPMILPMNKGGLQPPQGGFPPKGQFPPQGKFPANPPPPQLGATNPLVEILGVTPRAGSAENKKLQGELARKLVGDWEGAGPDGAIHKVSYELNGRYSHSVAGKGEPSTGMWQVTALLGTKGLKIKRGNSTMKVVFEDDELLHDTATPGETIVLRKK